MRAPTLLTTGDGGGFGLVTDGAFPSPFSVLMPWEEYDHDQDRAGRCVETHGAVPCERKYTYPICWF
eukprot:1047991-Rhodomonas_salina.3